MRRRAAAALAHWPIVLIGSGLVATAAWIGAVGWLVVKFLVALFS